MFVWLASLFGIGMGVIAFAATTAGCDSGGAFTLMPRQDEAVDLLWRGFLGHSDAAPSIEWFDGTYTDAFSGEGGKTWIGWKVQVVYLPMTDNTAAKKPVMKYSITALAHEFIHYDFWLRTGDVDPLHFRADWSLERQMNDALIDRGL